MWMKTTSFNSLKARTFGIKLLFFGMYSSSCSAIPKTLKKTASLKTCRGETDTFANFVQFCVDQK